MVKSRVPKYSFHKPTGQAFVRVNGKFIYLGKYDSPKSREEYGRIVAELAANSTPASTSAPEESLTILELIATYWGYAQAYYVKDGSQTTQLHRIQTAMRPMKDLYGHTPAAEFSPRGLKAVRQVFIDSGVSRKYINGLIRTVKHMFRWSVSEELVPNAAYQALCTVDGLKQGRSAAPETKPIEPVADEVVDATLPYLPQIVAALVQFQRLTGCRPGEATHVRPMDVDRSREIWTYCPASHKTQHHGKSRMIFVGPQAQAVLLPYLDRPADAYCFAPKESVQKKNEILRANRKTKVQPSQRDRSKPNAKRKPGQFYTRNAYLNAIKRAVEKANVQIVADAEHFGIEAVLLPAWHPNQLRHSAATAIRKQFGLEAAQIILGHSKADVTQIYAERDTEKAVEVIRKIG